MTAHGLHHAQGTDDAGNEEDDDADVDCEGLQGNPDRPVLNKTGGTKHDDEARRILMRNNRTSPYLWAFTLLTVVPAVLFWRNTGVLMAFTALFVVTYVAAYMMIIRFKVPRWLRR